MIYCRRSSNVLCFHLQSRRSQDPLYTLHRFFSVYHHHQGQNIYSLAVDCTVWPPEWHRWQRLQSGEECWVPRGSKTRPTSLSHWLQVDWNQNFPCPRGSANWLDGWLTQQNCLVCTNCTNTPRHHTARATVGNSFYYSWYILKENRSIYAHDRSWCIMVLSPHDLSWWFTAVYTLMLDHDGLQGTGHLFPRNLDVQANFS